MIGLGTMINVAGIVLGGLLGLLFGKQMKQRFQDTLMSAAALCVLFLGIGGCMEEMLVVTEDGITTTGSMMMIACFAVGALIGEWLDIDRHMEEFGVWLKKKTKSEGDSSFVDGFVSASLTVCIGAMAVVGSITDGITGDYSILAAKAVLDLIIIMIMTASMGKRLYFLCNPGWSVPGGNHTSGYTCGTSHDRAGSIQYVPDRFYADLLCWCKSDLG